MYHVVIKVEHEDSNKSAYDRQVYLNVIGCHKSKERAERCLLKSKVDYINQWLIDYKYKIFKDFKHLSLLQEINNNNEYKLKDNIEYGKDFNKLLKLVNRGKFIKKLVEWNIETYEDK
jgi:hypothetical protein